MKCVQEMEPNAQKRPLPKPKTYHFYSWFFPGLFTTRRDEKLFLEYTKSQKQRAIPRLLVAGLLLQIYFVLVPGRLDYFVSYAMTSLSIASNTVLLGFHYGKPSTRTFNSHMSWLIIWIQLLLNTSNRMGDGCNELLGWAALIQYLTLATLPFSAPILILYSILSMTGYLAVQYWNATLMNFFPDDFVEQEICNGSVLLCASLLGATGFVMYENQHRRSFVETKRSLRDKLTIDQQSKEQERLLLSVLPEHVAIQMRKDLGLIDTQFKKIYMSRHENVRYTTVTQKCIDLLLNATSITQPTSLSWNNFSNSILYADIVGFTAISSTYSAQDLVAILNELFARFDRLSEKYQQLRIKILGDCYYCISGAPVERPDHAVLCVHMGLSMVKAIKYVQQTTNSPVDMRVGIHTGAVLAGVLGQRQWQFDVYSRDVELANKMESSGMAGRVHVSEVTLGFLKDEFEVEPAYGEKREEMLRQAGIKTYFIVKVLKPYHGDEKSGEGDEERGDTLSDLRDDDEDSVLSAEGEKQASEDMLIYDMLEEELRNRDDSKDLAETGCCLRLEYEAEKVYQRRGDTNLALLLLPPVFLVLPIAMVASLAVQTRSILETYVCYAIIAPVTTVIYYICNRWSRLEGRTLHPEVRAAYSIVHLSVYTVASMIHLVYCGELEKQLQSDGSVDTANQNPEALRCAHPSYYYHMASCVLCCGILITPTSCVRRIAIVGFLATYYVLPSLWVPILLEPRPSLDLDPYLYIQNGTFVYTLDRILHMHCLHRYRHFIMIYLVGLTVCIFDRYLEAMERARHLRGGRMRQQAEQAGDLRRRNQALVYNVLPPHVARHFMGAHRNHRDLYSQSYAEVGVLFASMPNFTEFYSEETVNNQGLECLRFLNEVISDFDTLLEDARFRDIIKIKTISSTYMAASGLNPERDVKNADATTQRWKHLMCLVEFALELQRVLAAINEQSFNHFVLRMGVNHGPITAGVIGAKKPHYDIWGNTVNVASRMESTGKAGCIQVTEETCEILKDFGYYFEQRGLVAVKGKGQLMTYYLQGRNNNTLEKSKDDDSNRKCTCPLLVENGTVKILMSQVAADDDALADIPLLTKKK